MTRMRRAIAWLCCAFAMASHGVEPVARLSHPALDEVSGVVKSTQGDFYWVHNDSGDSARIFAIRPDGEPIKPAYLPGSVRDWPGHTIDNAWHFDWEDIALADGLLYVADVGNNANARRDLGVYVIPEPNPTAVPRARAQAFLPIAYPDQTCFPARVWHFDCEAVFFAQGKLYFITKHRRPGRLFSWEPGAKLYRLDTSHTDRRNVLTLLGRHDEVELATGADLSPDGSRLAISTYQALWMFERPAEGDNWFAGTAWRLDLDVDVTRQLEAIAWENDTDLILVNENRDVLRASTRDFVRLPDAEAVSGS